MDWWSKPTWWISLRSQRTRDDTRSILQGPVYSSIHVNLMFILISLYNLLQQHGRFTAHIHCLIPSSWHAHRSTSAWGKRIVVIFTNLESDKVSTTANIWLDSLNHKFSTGQNTDQAKLIDMMVRRHFWRHQSQSQTEDISGPLSMYYVSALKHEESSWNRSSDYQLQHKMWHECSPNILFP